MDTVTLVRNLVASDSLAVADRLASVGTVVTECIGFGKRFGSLRGTTAVEDRPCLAASKGNRLVGKTFSRTLVATGVLIATPQSLHHVAVASVTSVTLVAFASEACRNQAFATGLPPFPWRLALP